MMSNKWAFSLTSLITILAFAFVGAPTMAASDGPTVKISTADNSTADGTQTVPIDRDKHDPKLVGADGTAPDADDDAIANDVIAITVEFSDPVRFNNNAAGGQNAPEPGDFAPDQDVMIVYHLGDKTVAAAPSYTWIQITSKKYIGYFTMDLSALVDDSTDNDARAYDKVTVYINDGAAMSIAGDTAGKTSQASGFYMFTIVTPDMMVPTVAMAKLDGSTVPISGETVRFKITLSEAPKEFKQSHIAVTEASIVAFDKIDDTNYVVTIKPNYANTNDIKLTVKHFEDQRGNSTLQNPGQDPPLKEKAFKVAASSVAAKPGVAGTTVSIPNDLIIPAGGFLIVAKNDGSGSNSQEKTSDSLIAWPGDPKQAAADIALRVPSLRTYNVIEAGLPNLETELINGATIDLKSAHMVRISEIMWGTDGGSQNRQWIEIMNTTASDLKTKDYKLVFYSATEDVPPVTAAVAATATTAAVPESLPAGVADRVGTLYKGAHWSIAGKGQSGQTSDTRKLGDNDIEIVSTSSLVSMQRVFDTAGLVVDGTMSSAWTASMPPSDNFHADAKGLLIGTPGFSPIVSEADRMAAEAAAKAKADAAAAAAAAAADMSVMVPAVGAIYVSEVMFAGGGTLPQWIEISNGSRTEEVNLSGWTLTVNNAVADADVSVGASIMFTIPEGTTIMPSAQNESPSTLLVVTEIGRNNVPAASGQVLNLWQAGQTELILAGVTKRRYSLLSDMAFEIVLAPPAPKATVVAATATAAQKAAAKASDLKAMAAHAAATDMAGNLGADGAATWALPMSDEGGRSSIIRRHIPVSIGPAEPEDGAMMESWALASDTSFAQATHVRASSYYGAMNDVGTPGFRAGGALPVELSHFRPVRNAETGQVVITWSTQSELNNAGFFIKRSQQRDGQFQVINATMVAGAGTTSEKQFYTYTDSTAQPNVVYYYQIEDVSLDGNRQTLTNGTRLRGHIGAAGKLTATWGELKTSNE